MRWLFLLLLVMNLAYVSWELSRERPQQARTNVLPKGVAPIVLLSEVDGAPERAVTAAAAPAAPQGEITAKAQPGVQAAQPGPGAAPAPAAQAEAVAPVLQTALLDAGAPSADADSQRGSAVPAEPPVSRRSEVIPAGDLCYTLGPFKEMQTLRVVTREIKDYVVEASFRSKEEQEQTMFRVLIRPVGSKQEAQALIKELDSKKIRDHFIITEGPSKNAISLGYFSSKSRAYRHADRVRKLGFDAYAEPVFRSYTIYWLDYRIKAGEQIPQRIFDEHLQRSAQQLSRDCG